MVFQFFQNFTNCFVDQDSRRSIMTENSMKPLKMSNDDDLTDVNNFECDICCNIYPSKVSLKKHIRNVHDNNFKCDFCDEIFENEFAMKRHMKSKTHELKFKCPLCPMAFIQLPIMENHLKLGIY